MALEGYRRIDENRSGNKRMIRRIDDSAPPGRPGSLPQNSAADGNGADFENIRHKIKKGDRI